MTTGSSFSLRRGDAGDRILAIIALGAIVRFLLAATTGLGVDESYAVAVARQFSLSYFDHPPLHFWMAGAAARLAESEASEVVRFPFVLCFAGTTYYVWRITRRLFSEGAGVVAALLINISAVFSLSTGGWVLPDGPLMLCMTAAVDRITSIVFAGPAGDGASDGSRTAEHRIVDWTVAGALTGLAMLSKYHGVFVLAGTAAFLATSAPHRRWLATPGPYIGAAVALAMFTPVIAWNAEHEWVSFAFQGARAAPRPGLHLDTFAANIGGQMAWVLPWVFVPLAAAAWRAVRSGPRDAPRWFLACIAGGPIVGFTLVSLRGDVGLPHWQAPGWLFVFPLLGAAVHERLAGGDARARRWLRWSAWTYAGLILVLTSHAATGWMARLAPDAFRRGDPTGDMVTWDRLPGAIAQLASTDSGAPAFIAATSWIQAGKAAIALGSSTPVLCLCADPHHFRYIENDSAFLGRDAIIVKKQRTGDDVRVRFAAYFEAIDSVGTVTVARGTQGVMQLDLFRATRFRALYPTEQPR